MRINFNESAILANSCLNKTDKKLSVSTQRLSSGYKINYAKDNPAGLAISNRMNVQIKGLSKARDNTNDGISVVQVADGAMSEITSILQRMNELAVQAGSDTKLNEDKALLNEEIKQLKQEITRISTDTEFNGQVLLDGTFDLKGYTSDSDLSVDYYSDEVMAGKYDIGITNNGDGTVGVTLGSNFPTQNLKSEIIPADGTKNGMIKITADGNFEMNLEFDNSIADGNISIDISGIGAMKIQTGANEGQELAIRIPTISLKKMGLSDLDISTEENAQAAISSIKEAMTYVGEARARLGAYQNRLEHNVSNLDISSEDMTASYSRIMDVDMAEEMTEYTTQQVLTQAGISMLSQANERPQQVLQLLQ